MQIVEKKITELKEYENNPRNNDDAVEAVAESIEQFGFKVPIVIDSNGVIIAGHTRRKAAVRLGLDTVPCIIADDLTPEQIQAFRLADNKTAELAEWDKFTQSVMEAGRDDEGQQLVPLSYLLPAAMYRESDVSHTPKQMTWEDMQNDEALQDAVVRLGAGFDSTGEWNFPIEYLLGELADYKTEELLFTEDELLEHVNTIIELTDYYEENAYAEKEYSTKTHLGLWFNLSGATAHDPSGTYDASLSGGRLNGLTEQDPLTLVPFYSDDGGNTAVIAAFAAVNRNTRRPEDAFKVIDLFMSTGRQTNSTMFAYHIYSKSSYTGMPMHEEVMSQKYEMRVNAAGNSWFSLDDNNFRKVCAVRDQITVAQFSGALNAELENMMVNCYKAHLNGEDYTNLVHETYAAMEQMMAE